ncbi:MAG: phosphoadenylyl-sulfate reductase [Planctomycetota bacterium]
MITGFEGTITESIESEFQRLDATGFVRWAAEEFGETLAVSTSFGIQSAVTLKLVTSVVPDVKVIWVDTGYLPEETYRYAARLTRKLRLNLHVYESAISPQEMENRFGRLWESDRVDDLNLYDQIRKVEPMERALNELNVRGWISGLRAEQTEHRRCLPPIKRVRRQYRIYPVLTWTSKDVYNFMQEHELPQHPLFSQGFTTVGDHHSSRPLAASDASDRATRFRGLKQECGLHF